MAADALLSVEALEQHNVCVLSRMDIMKYVVEINQKKFEVEVERGQATIVEQTPVAAGETPAPLPAAGQQPASAPVPAQGQKLLAPMPGVIIKVKQPTGTRVSKGQPLLVLEAMKMENEVVSSCDGVINFIVSKGAHVAAGDVLAVIA